MTRQTWARMALFALIISLLHGARFAYDATIGAGPELLTLITAVSLAVCAIACLVQARKVKQ